MRVRGFKVSSLPSFPDGDLIPERDDEEFDKKLKQWWDEVKVNLGRQTEQIEELKRRVASLEEKL